MKKILLLSILITFCMKTRGQCLVGRQDAKAGLHMGLLAGVWIPNGALSIAGNHPYCGLQVGPRWHRFMVNATVAFKFLRSPNEYDVVKDGNVYRSRHFFGGYIGLDGCWDLFQYKKHSLSLLGGTGFDGFDALSVKRYDDKDLIRSINSLNLNAGLGYKLYGNQSGSYLGLDVKYNFLFYKNKGGTDFSGNALTLVLVAGISARR